VRYDLVDDAERVHTFYEGQRRPEIAWWRAAKAIETGEPVGEFFTLPWWTMERQTNGSLIGAHHNRRRLRRLLKAIPAGCSPAGEPWHIGVLYPGLPDRYFEDPVGVMTRKGHVGLFSQFDSDGGLDKLVGTREHGFTHVVVPVFVDDDESAAVPLPFGPDVSPFDNPWVPTDSGQDERLPWRINRSHLMAIYLARHGRTPRWMSLARRLALLTEEHGVSVLPPLPIEPGRTVVDDVRGEAGSLFLRRICRLAGIMVQESVTDSTCAVVTRYPARLTSRAGQEALARGIPIYRADEFAGRVAEARLLLAADSC